MKENFTDHATSHIIQQLYSLKKRKAEIIKWHILKSNKLPFMTYIWYLPHQKGDYHVYSEIYPK